MSLIDGYTCRERVEVTAFLAAHPALVPLLAEALTPLREWFPYAEYVLAVETDPEWADYQALAVWIGSGDTPAHALAALVQFHRTWWLPHHLPQAREGLLHFMLELQDKEKKEEKEV